MKINYIQNFKPIASVQKEKCLNTNPLSQTKTQDYTSSKYPCLTYFTGNLVDKNSYYIRMTDYSKNSLWAEEILKADEKTTDAIKDGANFYQVLNIAQQGVKDAYMNENWFTSRGVQRKNCLNPYCVERNNSRGSEYFELYAQKTPKEGSWSPSSNEEYKDANVSKFKYLTDDIIVVDEGWNPDSTNLDLAKEEYEKLQSIDNPTEDEINKSVATIHWLIAQESPFERGSDSIANVITKSIYHAYNMETPPIKEGHSFDFEAWYRDLDDFVEIYPDLFETRPHKVD